MTRYTSRKWQLSILVFLSATVGLFTGHLEGVHYASIMAALITSYSFANAAQYFAEAQKVKYQNEQD